MMNLRILTLAAVVSAPAALPAQPAALPPVLGRWDLVVTDSSGAKYPSWVEVSTSGFRTFVGRFVGRVGSARPVQRRWQRRECTRTRCECRIGPAMRAFPDMLQGVHVPRGLERVEQARVDEAAAVLGGPQRSGHR